MQAQQALQGGMKLWARNLLATEDAETLRGRMADSKQFLESPRAYTTAGQLKNFRYEPQDVTAKRDGLDALKQVEAFQVIAAEFGPLASYQATAAAAMPSARWRRAPRETRDRPACRSPHTAGAGG